MPANVFLDTNAVIYLYSKAEADKADAIRGILCAYNCITSLQVLSEASNVWIKKLGWDSGKIIDHLNNLESVCGQVLTIAKSTIYTAVSLQKRYKYAYYDCLILASALEGNCSLVITEDMQDGQIIDGVLKIVNPFYSLPVK